MFQMTINVDGSVRNAQLSDDIVLRQQGQVLLGGSENPGDITDDGFGSNFEGSIEEVQFVFRFRKWSIFTHLISKCYVIIFALENIYFIIVKLQYALNIIQTAKPSFENDYRALPY